MIMKVFGIALFATLIFSLPAQSESCIECSKIDGLRADLEKSHKNYLQQVVESKNVVNGPSDEKKALELASANIYKYVCDFNEKKSSAEDKLSLSNLVIQVYDLNIEDALIADMYSCFYQKYQAQKKSFSQAVQKAKITGKLDLVLKEGARH